MDCQNLFPFIIVATSVNFFFRKLDINVQFILKKERQLHLKSNPHGTFFSSFKVVNHGRLKFNCVIKSALIYTVVQMPEGALGNKLNSWKTILLGQFLPSVEHLLERADDVGKIDDIQRLSIFFDVSFILKKRQHIIEMIIPIFPVFKILSHQNLVFTGNPSIAPMLIGPAEAEREI